MKVNVTEVDVIDLFTVSITSSLPIQVIILTY